ncbi:MAG: PHP domain-containing protein [Clostridia bacterium]|nr:PHP domain-containing protein [Clostridia bacterium]
MRYQIDHDYHIHSFLSSCASDPVQDERYILEKAKELGLSRICITDHYWDSAVPGASKWYQPQNFEHISKAKPLPQAEGVEFLFGCETELDKHMTLGCPASRFDDFEFIIIPTTHLHMTGFTIDEADDSIEARARLWGERLLGLLEQPLPFHKIGIAHLSTCLLNWNRQSMADYLATLEQLSVTDMERAFTKAAEVGCGIELNLSDMRTAGNALHTVLRPFYVAKACGCKFYLGSDAHVPAEFEDYHEIYERVITALDLKESDKFHLAQR